MVRAEVWNYYLNSIQQSFLSFNHSAIVLRTQGESETLSKCGAGLQSDRKHTTSRRPKTLPRFFPYEVNWNLCALWWINVSARQVGTLRSTWTWNQELEGYLHGFTEVGIERARAGTRDSASRAVIMWDILRARGLHTKPSLVAC